MLKSVDIERIRDTAAELAQSVERLTPEGKDVGSINRAGPILRVLKEASALQTARHSLGLNDQLKRKSRL